MPLLTLRNQHHFCVGDRVRVKRHGYRRHYEGVIYAFVCPDDPEARDAVHLTLDGGCAMGFYIDGDYATVATPDVTWGAIPHPQSAAWYGIVAEELAETEAEIAAMDDVEPCAKDDPALLRILAAIRDQSK